MMMKGGCSCNKIEAWLGMLLWLVALVAVVLGFMVRAGGMYWGMDSTQLFLFAVALGVLAAPCKMNGGCPVHGNECSECGGKGCKMCK